MFKMANLHAQLKELSEKRRQYVDDAYAVMEETLRRKQGFSEDLDAVLAYYHIPTGQIDARLPLKEKLDFIAKEYDIHIRRVNIEESWTDGGVLPTLVEYGDEYRVVLPSATGRLYWYENGKHRRVTKQDAENFGAEGICFYKGMGEEHTIPGFLKHLCSAVSGKEAAWILILGFLGILLGLAVPMVNYVIFQYIIPAAAWADVFPASCILLAAAGMTFCANLLQSVLLSRSVLKMGIYAQGALFSKLLRVKTDFFTERKSGELADGMVGFSNAAVSMGAAVFSGSINLVLSVIYLIQMSGFIKGIAPTVAGIAAILIMLLILQIHSAIRWQRKTTDAVADMTGFVYEWFAGMEKIKLNGAELRMFHRWSKKYAGYTKARCRPFWVQYAAPINLAFTILSSAVLFASASALSVNSAQYIAFYAAFGAFIAILLRIPAMIEPVAVFFSTLAQVKPLICAQAEAVSGQRILPQSADIRISNLSFRYSEDGPEIFKGLDLTIHKGECIGITGKSGCGKSTLIRLLMGFEEHYCGNIFVGSTNFKDIDKRAWRKSISTVLQNSKLITGSIYTNITLTNPTADPEDVERAIAFSGLADDIEAMPMGIHTVVSEENCPLSGGQKQRLLIARAIVGNPQLVIFDEATGALDNIRQADVMKALHKLDATKIIIAHQLSTLKNCDRIFVIDQGNIAAEGDYETLLHTSPVFSQLMQRQTMS